MLPFPQNIGVMHFKHLYILLIECQLLYSVTNHLLNVFTTNLHPIKVSKFLGVSAILGYVHMLQTNHPHVVRHVFSLVTLHNVTLTFV